MAKAIQNQKEGEVANLRRTKEGRIQKKSEENVRGVHIEMKKYRISEISAQHVREK